MKGRAKLKLSTLKKIIGVFKDPFRNYSIRYIAQQAGLHYNSCYLAVEQLLVDGILKKVTVGNYFNIALNLDNEKIISLISLVSYDKRDEFLKKNPKQIEYVHHYRGRCEFLLYMEGLVIVSEEKQKTSMTMAEFERLLLMPKYREKVMNAVIMLYPERFWRTILRK